MHNVADTHPHHTLQTPDHSEHSEDRDGVIIIFTMSATLYLHLGTLLPSTKLWSYRVYEVRLEI